MRVSLYASQAGTDLLWTDTQSALVVDGYVSLILGHDGAPLDADLLANSAAWVQVQIDDTPAFARQPLASTPYAIVAQRSLDGLTEQRGTFSPSVALASGACIDAATTTTTAQGTYRRIGSLVFVSITGLPDSSTHADHCILRIEGLPFQAAEQATLSISHARGIQFKYNTSVHTNFTLSADIEAGSTVISTRTSHQSSAFSGYWHINPVGSSQFVRVVSGSYIAVDD